MPEPDEPHRQDPPIRWLPAGSADAERLSDHATSSPAHSTATARASSGPIPFDSCRVAYRSPTSRSAARVTGLASAASLQRAATLRGGDRGGDCAAVSGTCRILAPPGARQHGASSPNGARRGNPARRGGRGRAPARSAPRTARPRGSRSEAGGAPSRPPLAKGISRRRFSRTQVLGFLASARALWPVTSRSPCGERAARRSRRAHQMASRIPVSGGYTRPPLRRVPAGQPAHWNTAPRTPQRPDYARGLTVPM